MGEWNDSLDAALIRWIAILPLASAAVHGLLIGLVRARISQRSIWAISLSALSAAFVLSGLAIFELLGASPGEPILDSMGPWIGGGVGSRRFSAELSFQLDPLSGVFCLTVTSIALAVYLFTLGAMRSGLMRSGLVQGEAAHRTFAMLDLLVGSTLVLILADNFLLFFLGWAGIGVASQLFASFERESPEAARAASGLSRSKDAKSWLATPIPAQPRKKRRKLSARIRTSVEPTSRSSIAKVRWAASPCTSPLRIRPLRIAPRVKR